MRLYCFLVCVLISSYAFSQEESFPCKEANPSVRNIFQSGYDGEIYIHACSGPGLHNLSSSYLKPSGEAPEIIQNPNGPPEDTDFVNWTCQYAPGNLQDGDPNTAWVEGVEGYGIGEAIIIPCLDFNKPIEILAGYAKTEKLFRLNSRPKALTLGIIEANLGAASQYGSYYNNLKLLNTKVVSLKDFNGFQNLEIPEFTAKEEKRYLLLLQIKDVYKGDKWEDTCISELRNKQ